MIDTKKLTADLKAAREEARQAIQGMDDGGTCNFDSLFLATGKGQEVPRKSAKIEAAIEAAGCSCFHKGYGWRRGYVISVGVGGQANTRSKATETVRKALEAKGWKGFSVWYQVD